ncbi:MAG: Ig-like domain-containing protein [Parahaliea sp.]
MKTPTKYMQTLIRLLLLMMLMFVAMVQVQAGLPVPTDLGIRNDNEASARIEIGFPFTFYGQPKTDFVVTTNGLLQFGDPSLMAVDGCDYAETATDILTLTDTIYAGWGDWRTPNVKPADYQPVVSAVYGRAPYRRRIVQWESLLQANGRGAPAFQVVLYEGSGLIRIIVENTDIDAVFGARGSNIANILECWLFEEMGKTAYLPQGEDWNWDGNGYLKSYYVSLLDGRIEFSQGRGLHGWSRSRPGPNAWVSWTFSPMYQHYQFQILDEAGEVAYTEAVNTYEYLFIDLSQFVQEGKPYRARVRGVGTGVDGDFFGPWSSEWEFGYDTVPPTAEVISAIPHVPDQVSFNWQANDNVGLHSATLQIAADASFTSILGTSEVSQTGSYTYTFQMPRFDINRVYARVLVSDKAGNQVTTSPLRFKVAGTPKLTAPTDEHTVMAATTAVPIDGLAWPGASVQVYLNGVYAGEANWAAGAVGAFNAVVDDLRPGLNEIYITQTVYAERRSNMIRVTREPYRPAVNLEFAGQPLLAGATITEPGRLAVTAESPAGIARIQSRVNGRSIFDQSYDNDSPVSTSQWLDFEQLPNGSHTLSVVVVGGDSGQTVLNMPFALNLSSPPAPVINAPADGANVSHPQVLVSGKASRHTRVQIFVDGQPVGDTISLSGDNTDFSTNLTLSEGTHQITARASNSRGDGPLSSPFSVTYTPSVPSVVFVSPVENAVLSTDTTLEVSAIDSNGIAQVELYVDDQLVDTRTAAPWRTVWALGGVADGDYTLRAVATNTLGKMADATRTVTVQAIIPEPPPPEPPYAVQAVSITPTLSFGHTPIQISGNVVNTSGERMPMAALRMILRVQGFERRFNLVSDDQGRFSYQFSPQANDAGTYEVHIVHPEDTAYATRPAQGSFTINRLSVNYGQYRLNAIRGFVSAAVLKVRASIGTGATGVHWQALPADQPSGSLPAGITLAIADPVDIAAGTAVPLSIKLTGSASAAPTGTLIFKLFANESGATPRAELRLDYQLHEARPGLSPSPNPLEIGVQQTQSASGVLTITNKGYSPARQVAVELLTRDGAAPPAWISLASGASIGTLDIGQSTMVQVNASPGADVADGYYQLRLNIAASNDPGGSVPVTVAVAQDGQGSVQFKLVDIYTNTLNEQGQPIDGLAGARIILQNEALTGNIHTATSDQAGMAEFNDIAPGNYRWRASARNHSDTSGRITVHAGLTASERVFMDYQVVSIEFSVTETTIQDEYDIVLEATYQTQVPAPVVLLEPMSINLPAMQPGEEITGELTLSNYGLVRADDLQFALPDSDAYLRYEFFGELPTQLAAKSRVVIPYRITSLQMLAQGVTVNTQPISLLEQLGAGYQPSGQMQDAIRHFLRSGDGSSISRITPIDTVKAAARASSCSSYQTQACTTYNYECASGDVRSGSTCASISRVTGSSCESSGSSGLIPGSGGRDGGGLGGGWGGGWGGSTPMPLVPTCVPTCTDGCGLGTGGGGLGAGGGMGLGSGSGSGAGDGPLTGGF